MRWIRGGTGLSTSTDVELNLELLFMEAFDEPHACEHRSHSDPSQRMAHAGNAEWYLQTVCDSCDYTKGVYAVCDKFVQAVERDGALRCFSCRETTSITVLVKERIKDKNGE